MRKIILNLAVSLDGFIEGPNGEIDWLAQDATGGAGDFFDQFLPTIDSIIYGRVSYDHWGNYQPGANAGDAEKKLWNTVHSKNKFVFSHTPKQDAHAKWLDGDLKKEISQIKNQPGSDLWLYGGASLITSFINHDLIDRYILAIYPVILGAGKPLFQDIKQRVNLKLEKVESFGNVMLTYYQK